MIIPVTVGSAAARAVHFKLPVSFLMVRSVVEQGQCIREKEHCADGCNPGPAVAYKKLSHLRKAIQLQDASLCRICHNDDGNHNLIGRKSQNKCSQNYAVQPHQVCQRIQERGKWVNILTPPMSILAISQMTSRQAPLRQPLSPERTGPVEDGALSTFPICGFRYGGSSSVKEDGIPSAVFWITAWSRQRSSQSRTR